MRIAYITQSYPPMVSGASIVVKNLAENMAARGHQVLVIAASDSGRSYKSINGNLTVLRLRSFQNPFRVGQKFLLFPKHALTKALCTFKPDILHSHDSLLLGVLSLCYPRKQKIPVLLTIHALPNFAARYLPTALSIFRPAMESVLWTYARWLLPQFDAVTSPTPTTSKTICERTKNQPLSLSNGVNLTLFSPSRLNPEREAALRILLDLPPEAPILLYVGRLDTDKNLDQIVTATSQTVQDTGAHLVMIGDGRQKSALVRMCKNLGIEKQCHFPGYVSLDEGLSDIYRLAHLFVMASEIETQGIVLLEAAASSLPIVAVRATCIPEIVHNDINGYLVEPNETAAFAKAVTNLLKEPAKARRMGKAGRRLVLEHNIRSTIEKYEQVYVDLIKKKSVQQPIDKIWARRWQEQAKEWLNL